MMLSVRAAAGPDIALATYSHTSFWFSIAAHAHPAPPLLLPFLDLFINSTHEFLHTRLIHKTITFLGVKERESRHDSTPAPRTRPLPSDPPNHLLGMDQLPVHEHLKLPRHLGGSFLLLPRQCCGWRRLRASGVGGSENPDHSFSSPGHQYNTYKLQQVWKMMLQGPFQYNVLRGRR